VIPHAPNQIETALIRPSENTRRLLGPTSGIKRKDKNHNPVITHPPKTPPIICLGHLALSKSLMPVTCSYPVKLNFN